MNIKAILAAATLAAASFGANAGEAFDVTSHPVGQSHVSDVVRVIVTDDETVFDIRYDSSAPRQADAEPVRDMSGLYIA